MTSMTTWRGYPSSGSATTAWSYDSQRGFLVSKSYEGGAGTVVYTNTAAGRLKTRQWSRGVTTTWTTNAAGEIVGIDYSDATPDVSYNLDRLGRITNVVDGAGTHLLNYDLAGALLRQTNSAGLLAGLSISNKFDSRLRRKELVLRTNSGTAVVTHNYLYDNASRMTNASDGTYSAGYRYLANSPLIDQITFRQNSTTRMTTTKAYDNLNRLLRISSTPTAGSALSFDYAYNDLNQRVRVDAGRRFVLGLRI